MFFDEYDYSDYDSIARDADDLYEDEYDCNESCSCENWNYEDIVNVEEKEWENYYHNLTDEIIDD